MMADFFERMAPYARKASQMTGVSTEAILAQWAWETNDGGYGNSKGARVRNNFAGLSWSKNSVPSWSKAVAVDPRPANEGGYYFRYKSVEDFVTDYVHYMNNGKYENIKAAGATPGLVDDAKAMGDSPWSLGKYGKDGGGLVSIIRKNELWKYNGQNGAGMPPGTVKMSTLNQADVVTGKNASGEVYLLMMGAAAVAVLAMLSE